MSEQEKAPEIDSVVPNAIFADPHSFNYSEDKASGFPEYIRKEVAKSQIVEGLERAKQSYDERIAEILQPIRDYFNDKNDKNLHDSVIETLKRVEGKE